jgi:hypothetical protein
MCYRSRVPRIRSVGFGTQNTRNRVQGGLNHQRLEHLSSRGLTPVRILGALLLTPRQSFTAFVLGFQRATKPWGALIASLFSLSPTGLILDRVRGNRVISLRVPRDAPQSSGDLWKCCRMPRPINPCHISS